MKIVCESCGAKYSIADEKVAGKVFKIRCKKCSAVIVVKGDQQQAAADEAAAAPDTGDAIWHVVVSGEQQGPFAPRQIGELLADAKIDWEAYVWREGMDNWLPAKDVEDLVKAVMAESEGGETTTTSGAPGGEVFGGSNDMGADPFASSDDGGLSGVIGSSAAASAAAVNAGADLFADSTRSAFAGGSDDDDVGLGSSRSAVGGSPKVSQGEAMTGQRNENSVLFSLSNLQALATGSGAAPSSTASRGKAGMAQGEGSGLIDIRALASATQAVAEKPNGSSRDKIEDLLAVGATNTTFSSTALAAPVAVEKPDHSKTLLLGLAAAVAVLGIAVTYLVTRQPSPQPTAELTPAQEQAPATGALAAANAQAAAPQAAVPAPSAPAAADEPAQDDRGSADDEGSSAGEERSSRRHRHRDSDKSERSSSSDKSSKSEKTEVAAAAPEPKKSTSSGDKSLDDLLDTALGGKPKSSSSSKPAPSENLPSTPSRDDVLSAMKSITPKVQACGGGQSGIAMAKVAVAGPTGKVSSVDVSGQFAGSPIASCISKEVAKAKFPKFAQSQFSFSYPFKI